jgi:hypothetical protein
MKHVKASLLLATLLLCTAIMARPGRRATTVVNPEPEISAMDAFMEKVQADPFLSDRAQAALNEEIENHIHNMLNWQDKAAYANDNQLQQFVDNTRNKLEDSRRQSSITIESVLQLYVNMDAQQRVSSRDSMQAVVDERLNRLETNLNRLNGEINAPEEKPIIDWENLNWKMIGIIAGALLLLVIVLIIVNKSRKKPDVPGYINNNNKPYSPISNNSNNNGAPGIVVRRKTATILKKQSLEDVIDNPNYMQVDAIDFCYESAVRRMYIKNTCVIDIYNMYAQDLSNSNAPKENGCMVLGRWVHDPESNEYYVSLEEIVLPGDDAVFDEYALNFGGKIKLKVLEMLRKLRRETNLQYDLTCWVHSHPGLGVFFSNSDVSVQEQLKHPSHPLFLTAIVVDILTPKQELGIFTFQRDTTINSKNDLKKMYSLIEWYQWAQNSLSANVQAAPAAGASENNTPAPQQDAPAPQQFNPSDYFNTIESTSQHNNQCNGVYISKDVAMDICMGVAGRDNGIAGMIHGKKVQNGAATDVTADKLTENATEPGLNLVGCLVVSAYRSIPTVRRAVAEHLNSLGFVMVYTPEDGVLTTIPVVDNDLAVEEELYGETNLEELKQWIKQGR